MKTTSLLLLILLTTSSLPPESTAGEAPKQSPEFQLRVPFHLQYFTDTKSEQGRFGLASWVIFPNARAKQSETDTLYLAGTLWEYGESASWVEFLGGARLNESGFVDPLINLRVRDKSFSKLTLSADLAYFPKQERRRFYSLLAADLPLSIGKYQMRYGLESENILSFSGKDDSFGIGPRVVFPIPLEKFAPGLSSSVTVAYQFRNDQDFVRFYLGLNYVLGKSKKK